MQYLAPAPNSSWQKMVDLNDDVNFFNLRIN